MENLADFDLEFTSLQPPVDIKSAVLKVENMTEVTTLGTSIISHSPADFSI